MKRWGSSRRRRLPGGAFLAAVLAAAPASAQFDPATRPAAPPVPVESGPVAREEPLPGPPGEALAAPDGIYQQGLDALDPSSPGVLTEADGGFPAGMWDGSDRRALVALLPRLPVGRDSPAVRSLAERLLLSQARIPAGGEDGDPYDVLRGRVDRLAAGGFLDALADLFGRVPEKLDDPVLTRHRVDALLLAGDVAAACDEALSANQRAEEPSWLDAVAYCKARQGDSAGASFSADMLRDLGGGDPAYFALLAYLSADEATRGAAPALDDPGALTPLKLAMLRAAGVPVPAAALPGAGPLVLAALARDPALPFEVRLEAAERAAQAGAIGATELAAAYAAAALNAPDLADPVAAAAGQPGARGNALLHQAAIQATDPARRLAILQAIWARAEADGSYALAARVNAEATRLLLAPPAAAMPADPAAAEAAVTVPEPIPLVPATARSAPELIAAAPGIVRALLAAGDVASARELFARVRQRVAEGDPDATAARDRLWPAMTVADPETPFSQDALEAWWRGQAGVPPAERSRRGALLLSVLEALGHAPPPAYWTGLYDGAADGGGPMPPPAVWRGLKSAAAAGRLGETVLLSLVALGETPPANASPLVLGEAIAALRAVGLEKDARALALEAVIGAGL
jgi:hypothetical protein